MSTDVGYNCFAPPGIFLVKDEAEARQKIEIRRKLFDDHRIGKFLIIEKSSGSFVGTCGGDFFELDGRRQIELGYRLLLNHWGKGYATESASALLGYLFREVGCAAVYGFALPQNTQSLKILEKIGMKYQREFLWGGLQHLLYGVANPD